MLHFFRALLLDGHFFYLLHFFSFVMSTGPGSSIETSQILRFVCQGLLLFSKKKLLQIYIVGCIRTSESRESERCMGSIIVA